MTDLVDDIIAFEEGTADEPQVIEMFQGLIDSGQVWHLQGTYGRTATDFINNGYCAFAPEHRKDFMGRTIMSRMDVQPGAVGSIEFVNPQREELGLPPLSIDPLDS